MRRLRRAEIERRFAICEALQADPDLRYVDLQARFHAGSGTVRSAIKGGIDTWRQALGKAPVVAPTPLPAGKPVASRWEHACAVIRSSVDDEGKTSYETKDEGEKDPGLEGLPTLAAALDTYGKLGWELASLVKVGKGDGDLTGAWEATFKRSAATRRT